MKNFHHTPDRWRRVARLRGERLSLEHALRRQMVDSLRTAAHGAAAWNTAAHRSHSHSHSRSRSCSRRAPYPYDGMPAADRRAFAASVAWERLGEFLLLLGSPDEAAEALREAALAATDGEQYDHGEESLPARFLRIRFYGLMERIAELTERPDGLTARPGTLPRTASLLDEQLLAEACRLHGDEL